MPLQTSQTRTMTLIELIDAFRLRTGDTAKPLLWSDDEITFYLNEAQQEAAERALLIQDATTAQVCELALDIGLGVYPLHASILSIDRAKLSNGTLLVWTSREKMDVFSAVWETTTGTPEYFIDEDSGSLIVSPIPTVADTLTLTVKRLPLNPMAVSTDTPEIHPRHHYRMLDWALRCAYLKQDADTFNDDSARKYEAAFERSFGFRHDANVQRKQRDSRRNVVRSSW